MISLLGDSLIRSDVFKTIASFSREVNLCRCSRARLSGNKASKRGFESEPYMN